MRISVCVANYNGDAVIRRCLDSVLEQVCDADVEVLVHDDASSDGSADIVASEYGDTVLLVRSERNVGFCRSNNRLAERATGDVLLFLNNDTRLHVGALAALLGEHERGVGDGVVTLSQFEMGSGELLDRGLLMDVFANPIPNYERQVELASVMGSCLWIGRDTWQRVGGFPEDFGSMAEDLYVCTAVRLAGGHVTVADESGYDHVVGHSFGGGKVVAGRLSTSFRRRRLSELNKARVIALCYPAPFHLLALAANALALSIEAVVLCTIGRTLRPLREVYAPALTTLVREWPQVSARRRAVQRTRSASLRQFFGPVSLWPHKLRLLFRHGVPSLR